MSEHVDDKLLMAHEYDGIQELDNSLPRWWLYGFYFTIVFGFVYLIYYHVSGIGPSADQEYLREMADAGYRVPRACGRFTQRYAESNCRNCRFLVCCAGIGRRRSYSHRPRKFARAIGDVNACGT